MIHKIPLIVAEKIHQFLLADVLKELLTNYIFFNNGNLKMKILKNRYITKVINYHQNGNLYEEFGLMILFSYDYLSILCQYIVLSFDTS